MPDSGPEVAPRGGGLLGAYCRSDDCGSLLTFGIELEFLVSYQREHYPETVKDDRNALIGAPLEDFKMLPSEFKKPGDTEPSADEPEDPRLRRWRCEDFTDDFYGYGEWRPEEEKASSAIYTQDGPHIRHRIAKFLRKHGINAISDSGDDETEELLRRHRDLAAEALGKNSIYETTENSDYSNLWVIESDPTLVENQNISFARSAVEIKSPILYYNKEAIELVRYVVNLLVSEFRIFTNGTCNFHVHVGRGNSGLSMNDLRTLASVLYAAAPRIDQLHPTWCGPGHLWAPGIRTHSLMTNLDEKDAHRAWKYAQGPGPKNRVMTQIHRDHWKSVTALADPYTWEFAHDENGPIDCMYESVAHPLLQQWKGHPRAVAFGVQRIWDARNVGDLYERVGMVYNSDMDTFQRYRGAYNFLSLAQYDRDKKTVEFRQHAGTMRPDAISSWIRTVAGITETCVHAHIDHIAKVLKNLERKDPNAGRSWEMNKKMGGFEKVNLAHPKSLYTEYTEIGDEYSIYDFLWDMNLGAEAEWYKNRGIHPNPPDFVVIPADSPTYALADGANTARRVRPVQ